MSKISQVIILSLMLTGCSVADAAKKRGVEMSKVMACTNINCFLSLRDTEVLNRSSTDDEGEKIQFKSLKPAGSTGRAVMHGLLDVATLGIWEVAGTPIEANLNDENYYVYTGYFDKNQSLLKVEMNAATEN